MPSRLPSRLPSRFASLTRDELARIVPELLLIGQLIDRSGMAWCIAAWGREEMAQVAIEEWAAASPVYTRRMQRALAFEPPPTGGDVVTIFKGLQLDIGAPPQFMDFRYTVHDRFHGAFHLDHCGALVDVEPMGESYVRSMCHDIEDPTFDATAVASNPRAQVRPVHRPPRMPAGREPHCSWTVTIEDDHPEAVPTEGCLDLQQSRAAGLVLDPIESGGPGDGRSDYSGPLLSDLDFAAFSHSALVRLADEVCLQMHLLTLGFLRALRRRGDAAQVHDIATKQLVGIAGVAAGRLHRVLGHTHDTAGLVATLEMHPLLNPAAYVQARFGEDSVRVSKGPAHSDGGWIALCGPGSPRALEVIAHAVDPRLGVVVEGVAEDWTARVVTHDEPAPEAEEVSVTRFSTGAEFTFSPRRSLPITPV
jgi:hypothetical protein